jgi:exodeoxyribonuclease-5
MTVTEFAQSVITQLPYTPNEQQRQVIEVLARFCSPAHNADGKDRVFILNGYAGTGKTSLTGALVRALHFAGLSTVLLAPTGRAAKVFSAFAGQPAYTIHRRIYRHSLNGETPGMQDNNSKNTIFIVDEASMIAGTDEPSGLNLLRDLIHYVYSGQCCRMILLGDTAQLPPVGCEFSAAMDLDALRSYGLTVSRATLTATARQHELSGILANATWQRRAMRQDPIPMPQLYTRAYNDVHIVTGEDLPEVLDTAYRRDGIEETILVTRSNYRATEFNRAIRTEVLYLEEEIARGELMLISKNNYHWSKGVKGLDFVANGDIVSVERVHGTETKYGFRFADVTLSMPDREVQFDAKIMLETLNNDYAALPTERLKTLYNAILNDGDLFAAETPYETRIRALRTNPHWNALQVKYAYAVTCHKAQGGQWKNVVVDMGYIPPEAMGLEFYRWLYTATTRAREQLYFLNPASEE